MHVPGRVRVIRAKKLFKEESKLHTQHEIYVETRRKDTKEVKNHQINKLNSLNSLQIHINNNHSRQL